MQDFLQKHWKKLVVGGLAGTAAVLLLFLSEDLDKPAQKPKSSEPEEEKKSLMSSTKSQHTDASIAQRTTVPIIGDETKGTSHLRDYYKKDIEIPEFPEVSIEALAKKITVIFEEDGLSLDTIGNIFQYSLEVIKADYVRLSVQNRKDRRKIFYDNKKKYTALVIGFMEETENLLNKGSDELLEALNVPKELFENSCMIMMERGYFQQMMMLQAAIRQKIK